MLGCDKRQVNERNSGVIQAGSLEVEPVPGNASLVNLNQASRKSGCGKFEVPKIRTRVFKWSHLEPDALRLCRPTY
jgi:hypothetical protein